MGSEPKGVDLTLGDHHQFPPVARPIRDALFYPSNSETDSVTSQIGRAIYEEFTTVVILKEQKQITDHVWLDFLQHLRKGVVENRHIEMLRSLIIRRDKENDVDFSQSPWSEAALVTPRHAVRVQWNNAALRKMCQANGRQVFVCTAEDTYKSRALSIGEKCSLEAHRGHARRKNRGAKDLPYQVDLSIGMKVMVTENVETDLDITNGARGEIVGIVLHQDKPDRGQNPIVKLKYLPTYLLIKLTHTRASTLEGLDKGVIPVEPASTTYHVRITTKEGKTGTRTMRRRQFPVAAAYSFTDYRSQGQTIPYVIVDIAPPPTGTLNLFNLYVALSRSSGRETIRLLRDIDDKMFNRSHDPALIEEDERLERLDRQTKEAYDRYISV